MAAMQQSNLNQAMAMAAAYPMIPSAYYDQTGALIINNSRTGGPVRLFAPGPMFMNGSQHPLMAPPIAGANGSMFRYNQASQQQAGILIHTPSKSPIINTTSFTATAVHPAEVRTCHPTRKAACI
uniref:pumilio homolog 1-like n=1 Tax=Ciona intestinalis TaxID=7719 RepID=UPI00089DCD2E|nr:pumilio homolog 1-like [Ciona intestinalis]|eukprot:XP_018671071.1 pumilio homolog 1-like [Ciona intestinalis]